jgi:hypothetical protein
MVMDRDQDQDDDGPYDVLIHGDPISREQTRSQVLGKKDFYRRTHRNLYISIRDRYGISIPMEDFK